MFVISKVSRRQAGQVVACDLLRVVARCKNKLSAVRHNEAMYARLSEGFGGYLVTEPEALPVWRCFESGRVVWLGGRDYPVDFREGFEVSPADLIDATERIPAGSTKKYVTGANEVCAARSEALRPGWYE